MTRIWASELDGSGVRVNAVDPGDMATAMHAAALPDDDPATLARPEDRTEVFVRLASAATGGQAASLEAAGPRPRRRRGRRCAARSGSAHGAGGGGAPEARGLRRDHPPAAGRPGHRSVRHHRFHELLAAGTGRPAGRPTTPAPSRPACSATSAGAPPEVRLRRQGGRWAALVLGVPGTGATRRWCRPTPGRRRRRWRRGAAAVRRWAGATVLGRHEEAGPLVWLAFDAAGERLAEALHRAGRPVRYAYVPRPWPLHHYQTLFAAGPGSAEMASAGRPFTVQTLRDLRDRGIGLATISLHAGLSPTTRPPTAATCRPSPTWCRRRPPPRWPPPGGRRPVVAVGTTVVQALETAAAAGPAAGRGRGEPAADRDGHRLAAVDGLLAGLPSRSQPPRPAAPSRPAGARPRLRRRPGLRLPLARVRRRLCRLPRRS